MRITIASTVLLLAAGTATGDTPKKSPQPRAATVAQGDPDAARAKTPKQTQRPTAVANNGDAAPDTNNRTPDTNNRTPDTNNRTPDANSRTPDTNNRTPDTNNRTADASKAGNATSPGTILATPDTKRGTSKSVDAPNAEASKTADTSKSGDASKTADGAKATDGPKAKQTSAVESISSRDTVNSTDKQPDGKTGVTIADVRFELHGYARMPLSAQGKREPYLVDNDYFLSGFSYTRLYEPDWSELFFSARRGNYKAEFGLFASLYSDYASARLENQLGIAQASVTAEKFLDNDALSVQLGVFWDRFGYIQPYDTYIFGRTHQGGVKIAYALPGNGRVQAGIGIHQAQLQQNLGMTPVAHVAGSYPVMPNLQLGAYVLRTWTRDTRQLSPIKDGTMWVAGADARYQLPGDRGSAYLAFSFYDMDKVLYLAPALEVMHSTGGRGLTENFLGTDNSEDGTGRMYTLAADAPIKVTDKVGIRAFGMATWVRSKQVDEMDPLVNRDRRLYFKWGVEPSYRLLDKLAVSLRFDRVILDIYDSENSFRAASPKITFPLDTWGEIFAMYSHYWYGSKVHLRPGQVPLETEPDTDVFKLQAQVVW